VTLYLGPNVQAGTYQVSTDTSETLAYEVACSSRSAVQRALATTSATRRPQLAYVVGVELLAPVAGPSPWF